MVVITPAVLIYCFQCRGLFRSLKPHAKMPRVGSRSRVPQPSRDMPRRRIRATTRLMHRNKRGAFVCDDSMPKGDRIGPLASGTPRLGVCQPRRETTCSTARPTSRILRSVFCVPAIISPTGAVPGKLHISREVPGSLRARFLMCLRRANVLLIDQPGQSNPETA